VVNVSVTDMAEVVIDGRSVAMMEIVDGVGAVEVGSTVQDNTMPRVHPGSTIALYDARRADLQAPFVFGVFRDR
jgi:hypothetical protein